MNYLRKSGLSGSSLKIIALISMLIDHTGAVLVLQMIRHLGGTTSMTLEAYQAFMSEYSWLVSLYDIMRLVGRLAFPLFCFLLVEGFLHTRHLSRYIRNLGIFALISEPCFDLALHNCLLEFSSQNVFFTLFLGILTLYGIRQIEERLPNLQNTIALILKLAVIAVGCLLALWLKTDYDAYGILCISLMSVYAENDTWVASSEFLTASRPRGDAVVVPSIILGSETSILFGSPSGPYGSMSGANL